MSVIIILLDVISCLDKGKLVLTLEVIWFEGLYMYQF